MTGDPKAMLRDYLQHTREAIVWKLDRLDEYAARLPRTPTGLNLAGIVKHCLNVEIGYLGETFGRAWPDPSEIVTAADYAADPQTDFYLTESETVAGVVALYRRVWAFADETIAGNALDAVGTVPHWPAERSTITLEQALAHVITDIARHAGHADILREQADGAVGLRTSATNIPGEVDWPAYVAKLTAIAEQVGRS